MVLSANQVASPHDRTEPSADPRSASHNAEPPPSTRIAASALITPVSRTTRRQTTLRGDRAEVTAGVTRSSLSGMS
jgi:hypothetical protein